MEHLPHTCTRCILGPVLKARVGGRPDGLLELRKIVSIVVLVPQRSMLAPCHPEPFEAILPTSKEVISVLALEPVDTDIHGIKVG